MNSSMTMQKEQKVGVFVDVQNLYYSAKNIYKAKVNFKNILADAVKGRRLIRAIAYVIKADVKDEANFHEALENMGFEVHAKDLQIFFGGNKKGDWDVGIAMDTIRVAPKVDTVVLISGDGDFTDLVSHLKSLGCRVEVMAFGKTSSSKLIQEADHFTNFDEFPKKYLILQGKYGARRPLRNDVGRDSSIEGRLDAQQNLPSAPGNKIFAHEHPMGDNIIPKDAQQTQIKPFIREVNIVEQKTDKPVKADELIKEAQQETRQKPLPRKREEKPKEMPKGPQRPPLPKGAEESIEK
jgi:uncharacterized LabA/DUF88 family protein